jgi:hypothetical protein
VLLLKDVILVGVNPLVIHFVPYLGLVIVTRELDSQVIGVVHRFWIVSHNNEFFAPLGIVLGARKDCIVCH